MLHDRLGRIIDEWLAEKELQGAPTFVLERPADEAHGDYATPFCMQLARTARRPPRELAAELRERILADKDMAELVAQVDIAGPGFLNLTLSARALITAARELLAEGEEVGRGSRREALYINLEYVSVNPNGPLHVGHGRYAAYGDALARLLAYSGHQVVPEFYINDYGRQMEMFGRSVAARYAQSFGLDVSVPEDGYQGEYVKDVATHIREEVGDRWVEALGDPSAFLDPDSPLLLFFRERGYRLMLESMKHELERFRVTFAVWFSETILHEEGRVQACIDRFLERGDAYVQEDAVWLRTSEYGDDKDRVLIRSNERPTYFAADIAYHEDKLSRGFDHMINIWGADHHGYVARMKAAVGLLSGDPDRLEVIIGQLVNLQEEGEARQMSTRKGEMVTLEELIEAIGVDAARFFLVMRSHDQALDLDIALARRRSQDNPVYYVQYAHARICSIIRNLPEGIEVGIGESEAIFATTQERALIKRLDEFPGVVMDAADRRAPHRIASYAQELAADFHVFYKNCRVIGSEPVVASSRLALCMITRRVIARCLDLLGVAAPESM